MKIINYAFSKLVLPVILILVWFFNVRPFTNIIEKVNSLLKEPITSDEIPVAAYGAIDIALLTLFVSIMMDLMNYFFKKPIVISSVLQNIGSKKNLIMISETNIGSAHPTHVRIELNASITDTFYKVLRKYNSIKIRFIWHSGLLTVTPDFIGKDGILGVNEKPGEVSFNAFKLFSESDPDALLDGKLLVSLNSPIKKSGNISTKIKIEFENCFFNFFFSSFLSRLLIKSEITNCEVVITSEGTD